MRALLLLLALLPLTLGAHAQESSVMIHAVDQEGAYLFLPANATVAAGGTIVVMTSGQEPHQMRAVDGSFDSGRLDPGAQTTFAAPTSPGEYRFFCPFHASAQTPPGEGMAGVLTVRPAPTPTAAPPPGPTAAPSPDPIPDAERDAPGAAGIVALGALALGALAMRARR